MIPVQRTAVERLRHLFCPDLSSPPPGRCRSGPPLAFGGFLNGTTFDFATIRSPRFASPYIGLGFICVYGGAWLRAAVWPAKWCARGGEQSIPPPLRATMLRLLRLPCFPPIARREFPKSRPSGVAMLISPILFIFLDQPCSVALRAGLDHAGFGVSPIL